MSNRIGYPKYSCKYPNCKSRYYRPIYKADYYNKQFFRFPKNGNVSRVWKDICNIEHSVMTDNFFICEDHFTSHDFTNHARYRLKFGVVPVKPPKNVQSDDHDYSNSFGNKKVAHTGKYAFLFDNGAEIPVDSSAINSGSNKLTMMNVHQVITTNLLKLKDILQNEKYLLQKLFQLYKSGKFVCIVAQLCHISHEFLESRLGYAPPVTLRQWTEEEHFLALAFYNQSEKLYKYLHIFFNLPSVKILKKILCSIPFKTGINKEILRQIKVDVMKTNQGNRACVLMMAEMPLSCGLDYEENLQQIFGFEDLDHLGKYPKKADRVLVLMARGLRKNWSQVISYYFSCGPFKNIHLQNIIITTVKYLQALGLNVMAFVCEQNDASLSALKLICPRNERRAHMSHFMVNCKRTCIIFDVPHLLMTTRNAFTKCKIVYDTQTGKTAKLEHIESAYNIDQSKRLFKQLSKLKDQYFDANEDSNTTITAATTTFSHTVAAVIESFVLYGDLSQEALHTAEFVEIIDILYDSLNGSDEEPPPDKKYRCALSSNSPHLKFWSSLLTQIEKWKLVDLGSEKDVTNEYPFIKGWQTTLDSLFYIWSHLKHQGFFKYLSLKRFNLEPLENLLGRLSKFGTDGRNPTCYQFVAALKTDILNTVEDPSSTDNCFNLTSLRIFTQNVFNKECVNRDDVNEIYFDNLNLNVVNRFGFHEEVAFLSGYLLQKLDIPNCQVCRSYLLADWAVHNAEVVLVSDVSLYSLYASDSVVRIVDRILYLLCDFLKSHINQLNLENSFKTLYKQELESFKFCKAHNLHKDFINLCTKLGIYRFICSYNKNISLLK